ncbi:unnamed protein product [Eruca vesicaria subsp. sativa]|uniref:Uncharacterized protein n=1 Tax=Eruca vesicaria subsp. sativa TaxID=29727 RepID=A0ABC8LP19_ERUVS|nr:unnamed protein product [Eruca vesicaria subsp. sativa]
MEADKRHDDNTFSLHNILFVVQVSAALAVAGYCGYPTMVSLIEGFIIWFDWFRFVLRNIFFIFIILNVLIGSIYFTFHKATEKKKPSLSDEYITPEPTVISSFSEPMEVRDYYGGGGYHSNSSYVESVQPFQTVNTVEESSCYERVVMETNSKGCKRTMRSEKKMRKMKSSTTTVEYHHQRKESERVMKTASCRWQAMMDEMSSEEFRMTLDTFIMERKKMYGWQNGVVDQCQNGFPQLRKDGVYQWQNGFPQLQNGGVHQWQNGFPQLQNGGVYQWQNGGFPQLQNGGFNQWQGQPDYDGTGGRRLVGGSGCTSHDPYLAISN